LIETAPARAQLLERISTDPFDGGRTARWLNDLAASAVYRSVRNGSQLIHVVSDRSYEELTVDLALGLRLMAWITPRPLVWYWWDQPWVRELPAGLDPGRDHVNGGWAVPGVLEVHVYRREEAHKVMLHESVHALGLDVPTLSVEALRGAFERDLGRQLWPHLGEAFTELFAEWLWAIAGARSRGDAARRWRAQERCSARQAAQVWARIRDSTEAENTNVFAYYVLKWVLMGHLESVLLAPAASVGHWFDWWRASRASLEEASKKEAPSEGRNLRMGMTCPST